MILLVGLIVVGPERLPGLARTVGLWVGRVRRFVTDAKSEIDKELAAEELKKVLDKQNAMDDIYEIVEETKQIAGQVKQNLSNGSKAGSLPETGTDTSSGRDEKAPPKPVSQGHIEP